MGEFADVALDVAANLLRQLRALPTETEPRTLHSERALDPWRAPHADGAGRRAPPALEPRRERGAWAGDLARKRLHPGSEEEVGAGAEEAPRQVQPVPISHGSACMQARRQGGVRQPGAGL